MTPKARIHTVEIEGYGPVTIQPIQRGALKRVVKRVEGAPIKVRAEVVSRGLVDPPPTSETTLASFRDKPNALVDVANAILAISDVEGVL